MPQSWMLVGTRGGALGSNSDSLEQYPKREIERCARQGIRSLPSVRLSWVRPAFGRDRRNLAWELHSRRDGS